MYGVRMLDVREGMWGILHALACVWRRSLGTLGVRCVYWCMQFLCSSFYCNFLFSLFLVTAPTSYSLNTQKISNNKMAETATCDVWATTGVLNTRSWNDELYNMFSFLNKMCYLVCSTLEHRRIEKAGALISLWIFIEDDLGSNSGWDTNHLKVFAISFSCSRRI
jgi:hypothetical protein